MEKKIRRKENTHGFAEKAAQIIQDDEDTKQDVIDALQEVSSGQDSIYQTAMWENALDGK